MIKREIYEFLGLEKCLQDGMYNIADKLFQPDMHTIQWCIRNNKIEVVKWKYFDKITGNDIHQMCLYARREMILLRPEMIDSTCLMYGLMSSNREFFEWLITNLYDKLDDLQNIIDVFEAYGVY